MNLLKIEGFNFDTSRTYIVLLSMDLTHRVIVDARTMAAGFRVNHENGTATINPEMEIGDMDPGKWVRLAVSGFEQKSWITSKAITSVHQHQTLIGEIIREARAAGFNSPAFCL